MVYTFAQLSPRILAPEELPAKAVALNISKSVGAFPGHILTPEWVMAFVQRSWRISEHGDYFIQSPYPHDDRGRRIFLAEPAPAEEWRKFVGHYLPVNGKPGQNPIRYYETN